MGGNLEQGGELSFGDEYTDAKRSDPAPKDRAMSLSAWQRSTSVLHESRVACETVQPPDLKEAFALSGLEPLLLTMQNIMPPPVSTLLVEGRRTLNTGGKCAPFVQMDCKRHRFCRPFFDTGRAKIVSRTGT